MKRMLPLVFGAAGLAAGLGIGVAITPAELPAMRAPGALADETAPPAAPLAPVDQPASPRGGEITGVVTLDAQPLAGVLMRAVPRIEAAPAADLAQEVADYARRLEIEDAGTVETVTDAAGRYRLAALDPTASYGIEPLLAGYAFTQRPESDARFHHPGVEVNFTAAASLNVNVDVRMPDGTPAECAFVTVHQAESRRAVGGRKLWTPAAPALPVGAGRWLVTASSGAHGEYRVIHQLLEVTPGTAPLVLRLEAQPTIAGTVRLPPILERAQAVVTLARLDGELVSPVGGRFEAARPVPRTEPRFGYWLASPGRYLLTLSGGGDSVVTREVEVGAGVAHVHMDLPGPDVADYVVVRVHGPEGPVTWGVSMTAHAYFSRRRVGGSSARVLSDGAGEYWVAKSSLPREGATDHFIRIKSPFGAKDAAVDLSSAAPIEVRFEAAAFLWLNIIQHESGDVPVFAMHWKAGVPPNDMDLMHFERHAQDQGGTPRIGPLVPGNYEVAVFHASSFGNRQFELDRVAVTAVAGDTVVNLTIPALHELKLVIPPEYREHRVSVRSQTHPRYGVDLNVQGRPEVAVAPLRAGTYEFSIQNVGAMLVQVPLAAGRVGFSPQPFNALRVAAFGFGPEKDVGLRPGDLVLRIDGSPPLNGQGQSVNEWRQRDQTTWAILREGASLQVSFKVTDWDQAGLHTEPARVE